MYSHVLVLLDEFKVVGTNWCNNASSFCWMFNINNVLLIELKYSIDIKDRLDFGVCRLLSMDVHVYFRKHKYFFVFCSACK